MYLSIVTMISDSVSESFLHLSDLTAGNGLRLTLGVTDSFLDEPFEGVSIRSSVSGKL